VHFNFVVLAGFYAGIHNLNWGASAKVGFHFVGLLIPENHSYLTCFVGNFGTQHIAGSLVISGECGGGEHVGDLAFHRHTLRIKRYFAQFGGELAYCWVIVRVDALRVKVYAASVSICSSGVPYLSALV
jgi:hypothetical protein